MYCTEELSKLNYLLPGFHLCTSSADCSQYRSCSPYLLRCSQYQSCTPPADIQPVALCIPPVDMWLKRYLDETYRDKTYRDKTYRPKTDHISATEHIGDKTYRRQNVSEICFVHVPSSFLHPAPADSQPEQLEHPLLTCCQCHSCEPSTDMRLKPLLHRSC